MDIFNEVCRKMKSHTSSVKKQKEMKWPCYHIHPERQEIRKQSSIITAGFLLIYKLLRPYGLILKKGILFGQPQPPVGKNGFGARLFQRSAWGQPHLSIMDVLMQQITYNFCRNIR